MYLALGSMMQVIMLAFVNEKNKQQQQIREFFSYLCCAPHLSKNHILYGIGFHIDVTDN